MSDQDRTTRSSGSHAVDPDALHDENRQGTAHTPVPGRREVVDREREEHGGLKIGSCFFGWLTATGMAIVLTALAAAAGTAVGLATDTTVGEATDNASSQADTVGIVSGIVLLVIVFVAYYCGGYVAGRMARFDGMKQGLGVWLWAIVIAVLVAVIGAVAGAEFNVLKELNSFPRIPLDEGTMTTAGIIAAVAVLAASLIGALLGGLAGMRFHRKVDRTGLGH
ncbi:MAG: hypothetical protein JWN68_1138 [Nocardioides sp.]|uniref:hypothetical protein n=1 Tax=Nocardioides sp. TaxID=35761 RepID=UPI002607C229|nr:hypothetical protein [Nocardioides sp.]MCW2833185.1 hypothetical protein [Nocardioides sp.]